MDFSKFDFDQAIEWALGVTTDHKPRAYVLAFKKWRQKWLEYNQDHNVDAWEYFKLGIIAWLLWGDLRGREIKLPPRILDWMNLGDLAEQIREQKEAIEREVSYEVVPFGAEALGDSLGISTKLFKYTWK
jgi:hypothetical protein